MRYCPCGQPEHVESDDDSTKVLCRKCYLKLRDHQDWLDIDRDWSVISDGRTTIRKDK